MGRHAEEARRARAVKQQFKVRYNITALHSDRAETVWRAGSDLNVTGLIQAWGLHVRFPWRLYNTLASRNHIFPAGGENRTHTHEQHMHIFYVLYICFGPVLFILYYFKSFFNLFFALFQYSSHSWTCVHRHKLRDVFWYRCLDRWMENSINKVGKTEIEPLRWILLGWGFCKVARKGQTKHGFGDWKLTARYH